LDAWTVLNFLAVDGAGGELPHEDELMLPGALYHFQRVGEGGEGAGAEASHWAPRLVPAARFQKIRPHGFAFDDHSMSKFLQVLRAAEQLCQRSPPARDGRVWA
jgi:hypothetical protein